MLCVFFFFSQKTAYEMRISDWSSDVCSSDLRRRRIRRLRRGRARRGGGRRDGCAGSTRSGDGTPGRVELGQELGAALGLVVLADGLGGPAQAVEENGRAECRGRVGREVWVWVGGGT